MRRTERKKIETVKSGNQIWGHITLDNLANPEHIRITRISKRISRILQLERTRNSYKKW